MFLLLFNVWLFKVDRKWDVTPWTVWLSARLERLDIMFDTLPAKFMSAARANCLFCGLVANAAYKYILATFGMLFQNQIRVVCNLAHLHDEAKNVCIIV